MNKSGRKQYILTLLLLLVWISGCTQQSFPEGDPRPVGLVTIDLEVGGNPTVNGQPVRMKNITKKILQITGDKPKEEVIITIGEVAPDVLFETVLRILDRLDKAGYVNVSISLPSKNPYN